MRTIVTAIVVIALAPASPASGAQDMLMVASPSIADVGAACGGALQHDALINLPPPMRRSKLGCLLRAVSRQLNRNLPTRVDYTTVFERTNVAGVMMTYRFRADVDLAEVEAGAMAAWMPAVRAKICADPAMREIVSLGGVYRYTWRDRRGRYIDTLTVHECPA